MSLPGILGLWAAVLSTPGLGEIPEPLVFDLVRPLGAKRREVEVNALALRSLEDGRAEWAPEIEFVPRDGLGLEFEFPMEGRELDAYKVASQWTFPGSLKGTMHGVQAVSLWPRRGGWQGDLLHIVALQFGQRWAANSMSGLRRGAGSRASGSAAPLQNGFVSYRRNRRLTLAVEANLIYARGDGHKQRLIPQTHVRLSEAYTLQIGFGRQWSGGSGSTPVAALRLVRQLR